MLLERYLARGAQRLRKIWVDQGYEAQWLKEWATGFEKDAQDDEYIRQGDHNQRSFQVGDLMDSHCRLFCLKFRKMDKVELRRRDYEKPTSHDFDLRTDVGVESTGQSANA